MAKFLKNAAIAASAGLALGLTTISPAPRRRPEPETPPAPPSPTRDDILDLVPLLDRLEALERVLPTLATAPVVTEAPAAPAAPPAEPDTRTEAALEAFSARLTGVENSVDNLRARVDQTDENLRRLVVAIERLVERNSAPRTAAANAGFKDHLDEALSTEPRKRLPGGRIF